MNIPTGNERDDRDLLRAIQGGEELALSQLHDRYRSFAFALAYRVLADRHRAEDVVQDAFIAVWRRAGSYAPERGSVRTWLATIVRNRAIDVARAWRESADGDESVFLAVHDPAPAVVEQVSSAMEAEAVRAAIATLPTEQRRALALAYWGGHSHAEIADATATPLGTVKSRIRLGMQRLREELLNGGAVSPLRPAA